MVRGIEERQIVDDETDRRHFVRRLGALAEETGTPIYAWALMSTHVHILLCSGALGLANFMRRLLTGYAVSYNRRHHRHGHLFHNRYKSIVCDGDSYFTELVRYIHLNPLRVDLVKNLKELEKYPYCGHGAILGTPARQWQDSESVLAQFGKRASDPKEAYRRFVAEGIMLGRRPELVGGGLARSAGDWFAVRSQRSRGTRELSDERILGSGEFVERILREADARALRQHAAKRKYRYAERVVAEECKKSGVSLTELRSGSRRGRLPAVRTKIVRGLVENYGVGVAEIARQVGISTSGVSKILTRSLSS
jgi:REP element-mobilizing transposase RayT